MREVGRDVERKAVQRHPAAHADPDRADLGLAALRVVGPDADPAFGAARGNAQRGERVDDRSEEHTSELQSLMRISYAVFCLKKKKKHIIITHHTIQIETIPNTKTTQKSTTRTTATSKTYNPHDR